MTAAQEVPESVKRFAEEIIKGLGLDTDTAKSDSPVAVVESASDTPSGYDLETYLACVSSVLRQYGWVSRTSIHEGRAQAGAQSTADAAFQLLVTPPKSTISDIPRFNEQDLALAKRVIAWAKDIPPSANEYQNSLKQVAASEQVTAATLGFAASMIVAYNKFLEQVIRQQAQGLSTHLGAVDDKLEITVLVTGVHGFPSEYGTQYYNRFRTADGCVAMWRTNKELEVGQWYTVIGTVKEHKEWQGIPETILTRCTAKKINDPLGEVEVDVEQELSPYERALRDNPEDIPNF